MISDNSYVGEVRVRPIQLLLSFASLYTIPMFTYRRRDGYIVFHLRLLTPFRISQCHPKHTRHVAAHADTGGRRLAHGRASSS